MLVSPDWPLVNMWCPQTRKLRSAMAIDDQAMNLYPNMCLPEKTETSSLMIAIAGRIMM